MPGELTSPLQSLLKQAAERLPAQTGQTARYKARFETGGSTVVILADVSGSMAESAGSRTKHALVREALQEVWPLLELRRLLAFASAVVELGDPGVLPSPAGGTALHLALDAARILSPAKTLVISDGQPDDESLALAAAEKLPGVIDVLYCGPDSDTEAIAFMHRLARMGCGRVVVRDVVKDSRLHLASTARELLGLPAPSSVR
jgi:hypothetical protein